MASIGNTDNNNVTSSWSEIVQMAPKLSHKSYVKPKSFIELNELPVKKVISKDGFRYSTYVVVPDGKTLRHSFDDFEGPVILVWEPCIVTSKPKGQITKMALYYGNGYNIVNPDAHPLNNIPENPTWRRIPLYPDPAEMEDLGYGDKFL